MGAGRIQDDPGPPIEHPLQLLDGLFHDAHGDHRDRKDPVLVVEGPVLKHPLVQGVDDGRVAGGLSRRRSSSRLASAAT